MDGSVFPLVSVYYFSIYSFLLWFFPTASTFPVVSPPTEASASVTKFPTGSEVSLTWASQVSATESDLFLASNSALWGLLFDTFHSVLMYYFHALLGFDVSFFKWLRTLAFRFSTLAVVYAGVCSDFL